MNEIQAVTAEVKDLSPAQLLPLRQYSHSFISCEAKYSVTALMILSL